MEPTNSEQPQTSVNEDDQLNDIFAKMLSQRASRPPPPEDDDFNTDQFESPAPDSNEQNQVLKVFSQVLSNKKPTSSTAHITNLAPKRECIGCGEYNIPGTSPDYVVRCRTCYSDRKSKMRECSDCKQNNIPDDKPTYVVRCGSCYIKHRNASTAGTPSPATPDTNERNRKR